MLAVRVGSRVFHLLPETLASSPLLSRCTTKSSLSIRVGEDGVYEIDRDPDLFERIILPHLKHGYFDYPDPLVALSELSYYGLADTCPQGISLDEASVLCRIVIDRILLTMNQNRALTLELFCDNVNFSPLDTEFNVAGVTGIFGRLLASRALTDYGMSLTWTVRDVHVLCEASSRTYRATDTDDYIYAYVSFSKPANDWYKIMSYPLVPVAEHPVRYSQHYRKTTIVHDHLQVEVTVYYDSIQSKTMIQVEGKSLGSYTSIRSYGVVIFAATNRDWEEFEKVSTSLQVAIEKIKQGGPVVSLQEPSRMGIRVSSSSTTLALRNQCYPSDGLPLWVSLYAIDEVTESLSIYDTRNKSGTTNPTRSVTSTTKRGVCRMNAVLLRL